MDKSRLPMSEETQNKIIDIVIVGIIFFFAGLVVVAYIFERI